MDIEKKRREALVVARTTLATMQAAAMTAANAATAAEQNEATALERVQHIELLLDGVLERADYEEKVRDQDSAKVDHILAVRKSKAAADEYTKAIARIDKAKAQVEDAVDALLDAEKPARHAEFERLALLIMPLAEQISAYTPIGIHRPLGSSNGLSPAAQRVLTALTAASDGLHTPANRLGANGSNAFHVGALAERRARLIAGQVEQPKQANG